jgi:hypothetical protein
VLFEKTRSAITTTRHSFSSSKEGKRGSKDSSGEQQVDGSGAEGKRGRNGSGASGVTERQNVEMKGGDIRKTVEVDQFARPRSQDNYGLFQEGHWFGQTEENAVDGVDGSEKARKSRLRLGDDMV